MSASNSYRAVVEDVLNQVAELLGEYSDVVDGDEGHPRPNKAMSLLNEVEIVLARLDRLDGPNVPEGWKIVPLEPTEGMVNAFWREYADDVKASTVIRAVIEAVVELPPHATGTPQGEKP